MHHHNHMNRYTAIFLSIFSCTFVIVIECQSMLSMLWHLKADCDVQLLRTSISKKLTVTPFRKSFLGPSERRPVAQTSLFSKKHLIWRRIFNIKKVISIYVSN